MVGLPEVCAKRDSRNAREAESIRDVVIIAAGSNVGEPINQFHSHCN
jgi:hypothetical protein